MINKIVKLKNGLIYLILDKVLIENTTHYLCIDINSRNITIVKLNDIIDILDDDLSFKLDLIKN